MNIELHLIQNFAPSNLNRSDTGTPKECEFGGVRRARISSQCFKRAMRDYFAKGNVFNEEQKALLAKRTRYLLNTLSDAIAEQGRDPDLSRRVAEVALSAANLKVKDDGKTEYLVFLGSKEIQDIAKLCAETYWDQLTNISEKEHKVVKKGEKDKQAAIPKEIEKAVQNILNGGKAADLALFGRMLADLPEKNRVAACQVAHAISTHKVGVEFDFYTAVDDLLSEDETGAGMMGTIEFNSACFYRYANVDVKQLKENLQKDDALTRATIEAFITSMIYAIPTGKQNSMAAHNPPSFVMAVVRPTGFWALSNAFVNPIKGSDIVNESIKKLDEYWGQLVRMYGDKGIQKFYVNLSGEPLPNLGKPVDNINELIQTALKALESVDSNS